MTLASIGYEGEINTTNWSPFTATLGGSYCVRGVKSADITDFEAMQVTKVVGSGSRQSRVAAGMAFGRGVQDVEAVPANTTTLSHDVWGGPVATPRWDVVGVERDWVAKLSTIKIFGPGSTSQVTAITAARATSVPGSLDFQPLALVPVTNGAAEVGTPIDLRVWRGDGGCTAAHTHARYYLEDLGSTVQIGVHTWRLLLNAAGAAVWVPTSPPQGGWHGTPAGAEAKTSAGAPITTVLTIVGPPRPHAIKLRALGQGGFDDEPADVALKFAVTGSGALAQTITPVTAPAAEWVSIVQGAQITGLPANATTTVQLQASGPGVAYRRGGFDWDVI